MTWKPRWTLGCALAVLATAGCDGDREPRPAQRALAEKQRADSIRRANAPDSISPDPLAELPDDEYSAELWAREWFDSMDTDISSTLRIVREARPVLDDYLTGRDGRGAPAFVDADARRALEACEMLTAATAEAGDEARRQVEALLDKRINLARFRILFGRWRDDVASTLDCWRTAWGHPHFAAFRDLHAAQRDSVRAVQRRADSTARATLPQWAERAISTISKCRNAHIRGLRLRWLGARQVPIDGAERTLNEWKDAWAALTDDCVLRPFPTPDQMRIIQCRAHEGFRFVGVRPVRGDRRLGAVVRWRDSQSDGGQQEIVRWTRTTPGTDYRAEFVQVRPWLEPALPLLAELDGPGLPDAGEATAIVKAAWLDHACGSVGR